MEKIKNENSRKMAQVETEYQIKINENQLIFEIIKHMKMLLLTI